MAQRIDSVAERIDSLKLCCISAELLSSKPSNSLLPRAISTISKHFLNLKTYFENLFLETIFIVQNQSYGSPKFAQKHVFHLETSSKTFLGLSPRFNAPRALISQNTASCSTSLGAHTRLPIAVMNLNPYLDASSMLIRDFLRAIEHPSTSHHTRSSS
ncbi:hypothetical protein PIB30_082523 [Stylosanthes scabra]|uniref:Uncharacterized protein n=1 Tax=Stylosanthes scabra TaxID=79078 RepID=A0ABU6VT19_9FABA|nr:hypothetical protein [Stylosanthes scabra]